MTRTEHIPCRCADNLEVPGAHHDQIALDDRCGLRAPDIDANTRQHGAAFAEFRNSIGLLKDGVHSGARVDRPSLLQYDLTKIEIGEERIDGGSESVDHGSFARKIEIGTSLIL